MHPWSACFPGPLRRNTSCGFLWVNDVRFLCCRTTIRSSSSRWTWAQSKNGWKITTTAAPVSACRTSTPCSPTATSTTRYILTQHIGSNRFVLNGSYFAAAESPSHVTRTPYTSAALGLDVSTSLFSHTFYLLLYAPPPTSPQMT